MVAPTPKSDFLKDSEAQRDKEKVMRKGRVNSFFYSASDTFKFLAAVMLAAGMGIIGSVLKELPKEATLSTALSAVGGSQVGLIFLAVAAVTTAVAVGSQYISSRYNQTAQFDSLEINAKHTAKYLSKELQQDSKCLTEEQAATRADGKSWTQYVDARNQQGTAPTLH